MKLRSSLLVMLGAICLAAVATSSGCTPQQLETGALVGCVAAENVAAGAVDVNTIILQARQKDPAASQTLAKYAAGQAITTAECNRLTQVLAQLNAPAAK